MVILEIDINGILAVEGKCEPQVPGHGDCKTPFPRAVQRMEPPAGDIHISRLAGRVESIQHPFDASSMFGWDAARHAGHEEPLETLVAKAADHVVATEE